MILPETPSSGSLWVGQPVILYHYKLHLLELGYATYWSHQCIHQQGWGKGVVFVNGQNLGRHWSIGPQHFLYLPGAWLRNGENQVNTMCSRFMQVKLPLLFLFCSYTICGRFGFTKYWLLLCSLSDNCFRGAKSGRQNSVCWKSWSWKDNWCLQTPLLHTAMKNMLLQRQHRLWYMVTGFHCRCFEVRFICHDIFNCYCTAVWLFIYFPLRALMKCYSLLLTFLFLLFICDVCASFYKICWCA